MKMICFKLIIIILFIETTKALDFGKLVINDQNSGDNIKLKNNHGNFMTNFFLNASILNVQRTGNSAKITFSRDPTAQNNYALITEVKNVESISHYSMVWINPLPKEEFCVRIGGMQSWYSTYEEKMQRWPIDKTTNFNAPIAFVTHDTFQNPIGSIVENLFLGSNGFGIYVERHNTPLFLSRYTNNGNPLLCFSGNYNRYPYKYAIDKNETKLVIHLLSGTHILRVWRYAAGIWFDKPIGIPGERMIRFPIWSTWVRYRKRINQSIIVDFANQIASYGFPRSILEIDDKWELHYGDFTFDTNRFPNPSQMVSTLKTQGFNTSLWVYPFVNQVSVEFSRGRQYFIKSQDGSVALQRWWNGIAAHVDFTNEQAQNWFGSRLQNLRDTIGIKSFKFDAGEFGWINPDFQFSNRSIQNTPGLLTRLYVETAAKLGNRIEVRVGYGSQKQPILVRMMDKNSLWGYDAGLATLIPTALMMSIAGYPFVLPDMIGGNAYGGNYPSKELFIRWLQINTFMPFLQFSITPWDYGNSSEEVINISRALLQLQDQYSTLIIKLAKNAVQTGEPIMRPLWWVAPTDSNTFTIEDQFLVGNDLMVAPVTIEGARKRNIYLTSGQWKDPKGVVRTGPKTLIDYNVPLAELPYFIRV